MKILFRLAALAAVLPLTAHAFGIQVMIDGTAVTFFDVPQSAWFAADVRAAAEAGIVSGYRDKQNKPTGEFGPSNKITLAEALKISVEAAGYDEQLYATRVESDVNHWSSPYVSVAKAEGFPVIRARINLDRPATREEVAAMMTAAFRVDLANVDLGDRYDDVSASTTYGTSIEALSRDQIVSGDTDVDGQAMGRFRPTDAINRAEVAKIAMRARAEYGTPGADREPTEEEGGAQTDGKNIVTYDENGFSPTVLRIKKGDTVTFKNTSTTKLWVASDPHPVHTNLDTFDALRGIAQGEIYTYTFTQAGSWGFHNHMSAQHKGTIVVE